jgi:hypothetical protein
MGDIDVAAPAQAGQQRRITAQDEDVLTRAAQRFAEPELRIQVPPCHHRLISA